MNSKPVDRKSGSFDWLDRLIPAAIMEAGPNRARRARTVLLIALVSSTIGVVSGIHHLFEDNLPRALFTISAMVPFAGSALVMRGSGRVEPAAHYLCVLFAFFVIASPFLASDSVPLLVGLIAVPLAATAMGGARIGLIWTTIIMVLLSAAAIGLPFDPGERAVAWNVAVLSTGCGVALAISDFALERAMRRVVAARERADEDARVRARAERELVDSQALFATAFRRAPSMLNLTVLETGEVIDVNLSFVRTLGYEREEVIGQTLLGLGIWPAEGSRERFVRRRDRKGAFSETEVLLITRSGQELWVLSSAEEIDIGGRACLLSQGIDITERKRKGEELERYREELELRFVERGEHLKASQAKLRESERLAAVGTLAAGIAHQINNPIGGIVAASEFALMEDEGPKGHDGRREALETVLAEAQRCGRIVKSVLKFARDEPTAKWNEDLGSIVHRASELVRNYVEELGGRLEIDTSSEPLPTLISPIDIEQVVLNLIRNAAESRDGGAFVRVATRRVGETAEIVVTDDGRGIEPEHRTQVFDPFYTTRLRQGGSGLGLSLVHGVIMDHGGSLEIETPEPGGTRFRIGLPIRESEGEHPRLRD